MSCTGCQDGAQFDFPITMAFQPIVDVKSETIFAHEALVRGVQGEGAGAVLAQVSHSNRYGFDQRCRVMAIEMAADLRLAQDDASLSINFLPNAVYEPRACIRLTLAAALRTGFPLNRIIFEFIETESIDTNHLLNILRTYRSMGFKTAIDDFGSGYAGVGLLAKFQPDIVKLDMDLIRNIDQSPVKRAIVANTLNMLRDLNITPVCEGVETFQEFEVLSDMGVNLMQGYLFAKPAVGTISHPIWPRAAFSAAAVGLIGR